MIARMQGSSRSTARFQSGISNLPSITLLQEHWLLWTLEGHSRETVFLVVRKPTSTSEPELLGVFSPRALSGHRISSWLDCAVRSGVCGLCGTWKWTESSGRTIQSESTTEISGVASRAGLVSLALPVIGPVLTHQQDQRERRKLVFSFCWIIVLR